MKFPRPVSIAAIVGPLALMFCLGLSPGISFTEDLGRHLLLGRIILDTGSVPKTNHLTYTNPDFPFIDHHWLFEYEVAVLYPRVGYNGLIALKALLLCTALGFALAAAQKGAGRPLGGGIWLSTLLAAVILGYRSHLRPELFSFLFVALLLWLFEWARDSRRRVFIRLFMILIMAAWVNTHIYFFFGLGMLGAFGLERFLENPSRRRLVIETGWFAGAVAACFANPNGWAGFVYPFRIMSNYGVTLIENLSPWMLSKIAINPMLISLPIFMAIVVYSLIAIPARNRSVPGLANLIIATTALVASMTMARHVPLLALSALPLIARCPVLIFSKNAKASPGAVPSAPTTRAARRARAKARAASPNPPAPLPLVNRIQPILRRSVALAALCLNVFLIGVVLEGSYSRSFSAPIAPTPFGLDDPERYEALRRLMSKYAISGPVLSDFDIGSLVEFNIYPMAAYVDNRPEAFPASFWLDEYFPAMRSPAVMKRLLDVKGVNVAAFSLSVGLIPLSFKSVDNPAWAPVHVDDVMAVWLRRTPANAVAIAENELDRDRLVHMARELSEQLSMLPSVPWWRRQVRAERILLSLNGIIAAGGADLALPEIDRLLVMYPNYRIARELRAE